MTRHSAVSVSPGAPTRSAERPRVLVLGSESRMALPIVRSLGRKGLEVHLAWCPPGEIVGYSRHVGRIHDLPPLSRAGVEWKSALVEVLERERFAFVVPVGEDCVLALQTHRQAFEDKTRLYLLNQDVFEIVTDK